MDFANEYLIIGRAKTAVIPALLYRLYVIFMAFRVHFNNINFLGQSPQECRTLSKSDNK